jgi:hypothetical protein
MVLSNLKMIGEDKPVNIRVDDGKIADVSATSVSDTQKALNLKFDQALVFPGIINSHDHLDFNLFPKLGNQIYPSYTAWGNDIHTHNKEEIAGILKIPFLLRLSWGLYKNLLCGVTTVVNHGERLYMDNELITIFENTHCLHSVQFEKYWQIKLNDPLKIKLPAVIHVGEGHDWPSYREIDRLTRWNIFRKKLIGVHAVAMTEEQAKKFRAVVWCPQSNYFLLNKTSRVNLLKNHTKILFGTDSTLTGNWNFWAHLNTARETRLLSDKLLYESLNRNAVSTWKMNCGKISIGRDADIVIAKVKEGKATFDSFFGIGPSDLLMVIHNGNIRLFDETMLPQLGAFNLNDFSRVYLNNTCKYVQGDLPGLMSRIKEYHPKVNFPVTAVSPN